MKVFPNTTVEWRSADDCPDADADGVIENATVTVNGREAVIRRNTANGRAELIDRIVDAVWTDKGSPESGSITGTSEFMTTKIGIEPGDAQVTIDVVGGKNACLNC